MDQIKGRPISRMFVAWVVLWPMAAFAQGQVQMLDPDQVRFATYIWLFCFALLGWLASDMPKLAGWVDVSLNNGNLLKTRFEILQGFFAAELSGVCVYFIGKASPGWFGYDKPIAEMLLFVFVGVAGFSGTKVLSMIRDKLVK